MTRVAVTGAAGFVGRHVVAELHRRGLSPTLVARQRSSIPRGWPTGQVVAMDIADPPPDAYQQLGKPEVLIHLAWGGLPQYASAHHVEHELPAHASFLEGLLATGLGALAVTGTCLEYGMQSGALREEMPTAPVTAYGRAKDALRRDLERLQASHSFAFTWARLFYLYGAGQAPGSLLPQLEQAIARGDPSFDMSGGTQLRDYLPVEEAASYLVELALSGRDNGVVNICSGHPVSVRELVEGVVARSGSSIKLNLGAYPFLEYEPMAFWGDRQKLDHCLESIHEAV